VVSKILTTDIQGYRPSQGEMVSGDAGARNIDVKPFVMR
jgi:hypothetical protein